MAKEINPFIVTGKIEPEYFCDRVKESERLVKSLTNGNNLVIISPRRMGKTGLIRFCYEKPEIKEEYYTFFIDILHTSSLREFTYLLGKEIYETLLPRSKKMASLFIQTLKSINGKFGFDPLTNLPTFNLELGDIDRPEYTLEEIFQCLIAADKPCIVAIDEFQQITNYSEKNVEALLRTHIQHCNNAQFIFAGSQRHTMGNMFLSASRPFYQSVSMMHLESIAIEKYIDFARNHFKKADRTITPETIRIVYEKFDGVTWYVQKTLNVLFAFTPVGATCDESMVEPAIVSVVDSYRFNYQETLFRLPERQKELLIAIAKEGNAKSITSGEFVKRYSLTSPSSVQAAAKGLLEKDFITLFNGSYSIYDKFFEIWLRENY